jgi:hypothetical protein
MDTKDALLLALGAALGWYVVAHKMKTGKNV